MIASIGIDFWRSRMLSDAARRYHSRALEADALNFRADMYSATVVIVGLALTMLGERLGRVPWLAKADAVAALVVALVILRMSGGLARRAIDVLLDRAPADIRERMTRAVAAVGGVVRTEPVRLRESGDRLFADVVVTAPRTASLAEAHDLTERIEAAVRRIEPRAETLVHVEPACTDAETAAERIRAVALALGLRTHHEQVYRVNAHLEASFHIEVDPRLSLADAYGVAARLTAALRKDNPSLVHVDAHLEVAVPSLLPRQPVGELEGRRIDDIIRMVSSLGVGAICHEVRLYRTDADAWGAVLHCEFEPTLPMREVHRRTERIEYALHQRFPDLEYVLIQAEPAGVPTDGRDTGTP
jgi:divalent metal cation (Fe/Co/Zn/Cd) transporter